MSVTGNESNFGPAPGQLESVQERLLGKHVDEEIQYSCCGQNGCFDECLLKVHKKNGVITAIETDNLVHANAGREDAYADPDDFRKGLFQQRACVRGRGWRKDVYSPRRVKYPMLRVGPRGSREFKRISWDEALDLMASKYTEIREKYGPYSIWGDGLLGYPYDSISTYLPGGAVGGWAVDSFEPHDFADTQNFGISMNYRVMFDASWWAGSDCVTLLDSKLIILWGVDVLLNYPENAYYLLLAKAKGTPIIYIDPRYTWTAHVADQWIPIRPGTDGAMLEAMGYVMLSEDLFAKDFVEKWVEPYGLQRWREYLEGEDDGIVKTPEWAEGICGVPAETITELARLYARSHPVYMRQVWAATRMHYGENQARTHNHLLALGANVGHKGTTGTGINFGIKAHIPMPYPADIGQSQGKGGFKTLCEAEMWHHAINLWPKVEAGEMNLDDYKAEIGCPQGESAPNFQMLVFISNPRNLALNYYDANARIEAMKKVSFSVYATYDWASSSAWYADLVLPLAHQFFEGGGDSQTFHGGGYGFNKGFSQKINNYFIGTGKIVEPPGEAATKIWILKEVANRLGIGDEYAAKIKDVSREDFHARMTELAGESYDAWRQLPEIAKWNPPTFEEFQKVPIFRVPIDDYNVRLKEEFENDIPLDTASGKIEFYSDWLATHDFKKATQGTKTYGKGVISPMPKYKHQPYSLFSSIALREPLYMITPHAFYRQHFAQDGNPWFRDEYRPSVWISVADAKARSIKDNDLVLVENGAGQCMLPAYVTSRLTPGVACMIFGRQYEPSNVKTDLMPDGICTAGSCNFLISDDHFDARRGILLCNSMVEVKKANRSLPGIYED
ncbi:MAG: molybdopterin-dependent oxidoreductase [Coriobacteriia bacterium]